jgi:imidazolonepropionase
MTVLRNIRRLASCRAEGGQGDIHYIEQAAVVWENGKFVFVGKEHDLPAFYKKEKGIDAKGMLAIPGLIDCHTHLAFGGWRQEEFVLRNSGKSYEEILKAGGGIHYTVSQTRAASGKELFDKAAAFLSEMAALGITTVECKSGYGLSHKDEIKILEVYDSLKKHSQIRLVPTFLGAHTVPAEFKDNRNEYLRLICEKLLPEIKARNLSDFCDVFMEDGAFSKDETKIILQTASRLGFKLKLHADQITSGGGAELAASFKAASADHLECVSEAGISALAEAGTVAVLLPLASLYLRKEALDARRLLLHNVKIAVASDFNPGSAPSFHLPLALTISCIINRLTPEQALKGATIYAAKALNLEQVCGSIEIGKAADICLIDSVDVRHWLYHFSENRCGLTVSQGKIIYQKI